MAEEIPIEDPPLTTEEESALARLRQSDFRLIDDTILANCSRQWHKVARVAGLSKDALESRYPDFSCVFYSQRVAGLVEESRLDSQGDLSCMRFSEVRLHPNDET